MGQGITLAPGLLADADVATGRLVVVWRTKDTSERGFYVVSPTTDASSPAIQAVIDWLLGEARQ